MTNATYRKSYTDSGYYYSFIICKKDQEGKGDEHTPKYGVQTLWKM